MTGKKELRKAMRAQRREHVASLPEAIRALVFRRPPGPVAARIPDGATIALYCATDVEAPTLSWAKWFYEAGHPLALPRFASREAGMDFREWANPFLENELETGPFGMLQPRADAATVTPDVAVMPLLAFTPRGDRLGQGGGHYDRWLDSHPQVIRIGLGWDCQLVDELPVEPHDLALDMVVTPTRTYEGG